ncbi:MAG TPA: flagellar hook-associated protein FlgL [Burkholderiaceae bacterium]|nr:flagellar hook-associated protein FlgL [Burkholderiaceae bacterium]
MMLRIASAQSFDAGVDQLQKRQRELAESQERLTSGKRVARASDDPSAAARAERALAAVSRQDANQRALQASRAAMSLTEGALADAGELIQQAREALVAAGNASYSDAERKGVGERLAGIRQQLLAVANRGDGLGGYLFAGQGAVQPPFVDGVGGVAFRGTAGEVQVASGEALPRSIDGELAWNASPSGNGLFATRNSSASPQTAGAWIDAGRVSDPQAFFAATSPPAVADPDALRYTVQFAPGPSGTTVSVFKDGAPTSVANAAFTSGRAIEVDGMAFTVSGQPTAGDRFELALSQPKLSVFDTLDRAIAELRTPLRSSAAITQGVQGALASLDGSMGALQSLRSRVGEILNRTDMVEGRIASQKLVAQTERSTAEDLDMVQAVSEFQNRQTGYDAALKSYASVQRLSLFQYLNG